MKHTYLLYLSKVVSSAGSSAISGLAIHVLVSSRVLLKMVRVLRYASQLTGDGGNLR